MARRKVKVQDLFEPVATYVLTPEAMRLPPANMDTDTWRDLRDIGLRLSCPATEGESIEHYVNRLRALLDGRDLREYVEGAALYMLQMTLDLYAPRSTSASATKETMRPHTRENGGEA